MGGGGEKAHFRRQRSSSRTRPPIKLTSPSLPRNRSRPRDCTAVREVKTCREIIGGRTGREEGAERPGGPASLGTAGAAAGPDGLPDFSAGLPRLPVAARGLKACTYGTPAPLRRTLCASATVVGLGFRVLRSRCLLRHRVSESESADPGPAAPVTTTFPVTTRR